LYLIVWKNFRSDGSEYSGSIYQQVNNKLESGILLSWSSINSASSFGIGCLYKLNSATHIRVSLNVNWLIRIFTNHLIIWSICQAKINNNSQIGIGITHFLHPGIVLSLCSHVEGKSLNEGGHMFGVGLELEA